MRKYFKEIMPCKTLAYLRGNEALASLRGIEALASIRGIMAIFAVLLISINVRANVENAQVGFEMKSVEVTNPDSPTGFVVSWKAMSSSIFFANVHVDYRFDEYDDNAIYMKLNVMRDGKVITQCTSSDSMTSDWMTPPSFTQTFKFDSPLTYNGTYTISLPRGLVTDTNDPNNAKYVSDAQEVTIEVTAGIAGGDDDPGAIPNGKIAMTSCDPAEYEYPESLSKIEMQWVDNKGNSGYWLASGQLKVYADDAPYCTASVENRTSADETTGKTVNTIIITPDAEIDISGRYYIDIPAAAIGNAPSTSASTAFNDEYRLSYIVKAPFRYVPLSVYPKDGSAINYLEAGDLRSVVLDYQSPMTVNPEILPYFEYEDGSLIYAANVRPFNLEGTYSVICEFEGYDDFKSGTYKFMLPRGAVKEGERFSATYYYTGKPAVIVKEDPVELVSAKIYLNGATCDLMKHDNGIAYVEDGSTISISTTYDDICDYYFFRILDVTDFSDDSQLENATPIIVNFMKKGVGFSADIFTPAQKPFKFSEEKEYLLTVECYSNYFSAARRLEGVAVGPRFTGTAPGYVYSDVKLLTVTPQPGGEMGSDNMVKLKFDKPVRIVEDLCGIPRGQQGKAGITGSESNDDMTEWTIQLPGEVVAECSGPNSLNIRLAFNDMQGQRVHPKDLNVPDSDNVTPVRNMGEEENATICLWYGTFAGCSYFDVTPAPGQQVASLYEFEYTYKNGEGEINPSWLGHTLTLVDESGLPVATMICDEPEHAGGNVGIEYAGDPDDFDAPAVKIRLRLDREVTEPGTYTLHYPYNYFSMGREMDASNSHPVSHSYVVLNDTGTGVSETSVQKIRVWSEGKVVFVSGLNPGEQVEAYAATGMSAAYAVAGANGVARFEVLPKSMYVIRASHGRNVKIMTR